MEYNYQQYIKLLKYEEDLKKQNKSFETENRIKYFELLDYAVMMTDYFHWCQKNEYLELIKHFLNFKINAETFDKKFSKMVRVIEKKCTLLAKNYEELEGIEVNSISFEFGTWISEIYLCCNEFYPTFKEEEDRASIPIAKTEEQLRDAVKNLLPEIEKYF